MVVHEKQARLSNSPEYVLLVVVTSLASWLLHFRTWSFAKCSEAMS